MALLMQVFVFGVMLQNSNGLKTSANPQLQLKPEALRWLHIPKSGTSWINTLATWGCPGLADDKTIQGSGAFGQGWLSHNQDSMCNTSFCALHDAIGVGCNSLSSNHSEQFVTLFRQPEQRLISGFHDSWHSWAGGLFPSMKQYAKGVSGCAVRLMTGYPCGKGPINVDEALHNLHTMFAFVGLTEEWDLSVCLFHRMFGGACHPREFINVRPGGSHKPGEAYDVAVLDGFKDEPDGILYAEANKTFWANIEKFEVTEESCRKESCFPSDPARDDLEAFENRM
mmetsp:Transcript_65886/g.212526  ORF Transcript_65886/g.212526 Transcript_65886/m.212526 type:complete len:283 (+) Transcript_65886:75-923(+)